MTTKPVSAAVAPTIAARTLVAVEGEYRQSEGSDSDSSICTVNVPKATPASAPSSGRAQRLSLRDRRTRKTVLHTASQVVTRPGTTLPASSATTSSMRSSPSGR